MRYFYWNFGNLRKSICDLHCLLCIRFRDLWVHHLQPSEVHLPCGGKCL
nr:MAG TPA: hypothetical protein [Caudoviricetes sp.]